MENPKVSIIVPIYNVEKYLDRCMESLLNQSLNDIEIIMVDDGSPDNCPEMCDEYANKDSRVRVIHKQNAGLGFARNSGLEVATGEYVAFVDSDDYVEIETYKILYNEAKASNADYVCCGYNRIKNGKCVWKYSGETSEKNDVFENDECLDVLMGMVGFDAKKPKSRHFDFAVWHGVYRNQLIREKNIRFRSERELISEDIVFHTSFIPFCKIIKTIPISLYNYCENPETLTTRYKPGRFEAIFKLYEYLVGELKTIVNRNNESLQKRIYYFLIDKVISTMSYEARFNKKSAKSEITKICKNVKVQQAFHHYPIMELDVKKYLICSMVRFNMPYLVWLMFKLKNR